MKTIQTTFLVLWSAAAISAAVAAESEAAKKDLAQLQGELTMVSGATDGQPIPDAMRAQM